MRAMLQLAAGLGMAVCAEGVERADQLAILQAYGCAKVQGYLIGYPERALPDLADFYERLNESIMFMGPRTVGG